MTLMPPMDTLPLTILFPFCEASGCTRSSVVGQDSPLLLCFLLPTHTMPLLHNRLLAWAMRLYQIRPRVIRLDAAYWGLRLIAWIHACLGQSPSSPTIPRTEEPLLLASHLDQRRTGQTQWHRTLLWARFSLFSPATSTSVGWSEIASQVALTYAASVIVGLAAQQAGRPDLIRSPKRVLAHLWEGDSQL